MDYFTNRGILPLATAWTPASLPNLWGWWKATTGVYTDAGVTPATNGQSVQQWNDLSGGGRHLTQPTSGVRPTWQSTGFQGGKNSVRCTAASSQFIKLLSVALDATAFSIWITFSTGGGSSSNDGLFSLKGAGDTRDFNGPGGGLMNSSDGAGNFQFYSNSQSLTVAAVTNTPECLGFNYDDADSPKGTGYLNFTSIGNYPAVSLRYGNPTADIRFGTRDDEIPVFNGDYGEIIMTTSKLGSTDLTSLHSYLTTGWGIA